ncbi:MAG TPA: exodeoxyribonuclease VII large subunit [Planctomycetota bacterium]|nr:exodeoxyribonuclease VII large subunit [Planctomycetota bacterium]
MGELQSAVRNLLEEEFGRVWVEGELSGVKRAQSGHVYFALKDEKARLDVVLWRSSAVRLKFEPEDGLTVRARGRLTVYAPQGRYQMEADALEPVGAGPLQVAFEQLRKRLEAEGLFDPARKRPLPAFPRRVALVTSPSGAAVRDLIHVASRRWPPLELVVVPVRVQGAGAAEEVAEGIRLADARGFDVLVVGRGGGSLEDLWAFNEEPVARAIFQARTPVVSAVGHEVDVTIADLVADVRAATPSAAAEVITPDRAEILGGLRGTGKRLARAMLGILGEARRRVEQAASARPFRRPLERVHDLAQALDGVGAALVRGAEGRMRARAEALERAAGRLDALSPLKVLARGYSVTLSGGKVLTRAADAHPGDELRTILADGEVRSRVTGG